MSTVVPLWRPYCRWQVASAPSSKRRDLQGTHLRPNGLRRRRGLLPSSERRDLQRAHLLSCGRCDGLGSHRDRSRALLRLLAIWRLGLHGRRSRRRRRHGGGCRRRRCAGEARRGDGGRGGHATCAQLARGHLGDPVLAAKLHVVCHGAGAERSVRHHGSSEGPAVRVAQAHI